MASEPFVTLKIDEWIGGFVLWMLRGFRGKLKDRYNEQYKGRNVFVGWVVQLGGFIVLFYLAFVRK